MRFPFVNICLLTVNKGTTPPKQTTNAGIVGTRIDVASYLFIGSASPVDQSAQSKLLIHRSSIPYHNLQYRYRCSPPVTMFDSCHNGLSSHTKMFRRWWSRPTTTPPPEDTRTMSTTNDDDDCSLCDMYLKGPCGKQFQAWYDCTEQHPDTFADTCQRLFVDFQRCLQAEETRPFQPPGS